MDLEKIKVEISKLSIEDQSLLRADLDKLTLKGVSQENVVAPLVKEALIKIM